MSSDTPESITGGCLCGAIRYTITFPPDHPFKDQTTTCQCFQCRKNTGSLFARFHVVPLSALKYSSQDTLKTYSASPQRKRGFCSECGGFIFWHDETTQRIGMTVGTFDREVLARWGNLLTDTKTHIWCADEIPGVTDHLKGEKWKLNSVGEGAERAN
ncbi:Mss4-like protein [Ilyonectria robusta]|uniref:Mss4-like protein n=1 Tax=Ilyonectria robusta TaxID=1079257 RepID=UPI001E8CFFB9|nr:Mss4-like protein [Ilyonectria robusta]KAH8676966.1 Mss4-like protein [Ilyonectria robusta]